MCWTTFQRLISMRTRQRLTLSVTTTRVLVITVGWHWTWSWCTDLLSKMEASVLRGLQMTSTHLLFSPRILTSLNRTRNLCLMSGSFSGSRSLTRMTAGSQHRLSRWQWCPRVDGKNARWKGFQRVLCRNCTVRGTAISLVGSWCLALQGTTPIFHLLITHGE